MKIPVIAGSYHQYEYWLKHNNKNPKDYFYVHDSHQLRGCAPEKIVLVERYYDSEFFRGDGHITLHYLTRVYNTKLEYEYVY